MSSLLDALGGHRLFAEFPATLEGAWMPACETAVQEGLRAWTFPAGDAKSFQAVLRSYGRRARIGVHGLLTPEAVAEAAASGAHFLTSPLAGSVLVEAARGVPILLGALTPNEIGHALRLRPAGVQVTPADVLGIGSAVAIARLFGDAPVAPVGRFLGIEAQQAFAGGAEALGLSSASLFPDGTAGDLDVFRGRVRQFVAAQEG